MTRTSTTTALSSPSPTVPLRSPRTVGQAHLVGICGSGMKALAELLVDLGWRVSGSDLQPPGPSLQRLARRGLSVRQGHDTGHVPTNTEVLVHSPAIPPTNPERQAAATLGIPQFSYTQMLARLMNCRTGVAIAGTHGKSTTTAMTGSILTDAGRDPSVICGAELCEHGVSGWAGESELFVAESCEYQRNFLELRPKYATILSIEPDHFDCFADLEKTQAAFAEFATHLSADGLLLVRGDCPAAVAAARSAAADVMTFSLSAESDWWADDLRRTSSGMRFRVFRRGQYFTELFLQIPGTHNVLNALAAAALCHEIGISPADIRESLQEFRGIRRRFEFIGSWRGVTIIDDYAHHPTAVQTTLQTAREVFGRRRLWCAFQPHQVSRTTALMEQFATSFASADEVLIAPAFAAREAVQDEPAHSSRELAGRIGEHGQRVRFCDSLDRIISTLEDEARPGDVLITMGAGDIDRVHHEFTRRLRRHPAARRAAGPPHLDEVGWSRAILPHSA